jgi:SPIRAL1-like protein
MSRGGSAGGGQSSLGYLFGGGEPPKPAVAPAAAAPPVPAEALPAAGVPTEKASPVKGEVSKQIPAGIPGSQTNNYQRADGQNTGNFLTVWLFLLLLTCEIDIRFYWVLFCHQMAFIHISCPQSSTVSKDVILLIIRWSIVYLI